MPIDDPKLKALAGLEEDPQWMDKTWPFVLHGDGGTYARKTQSSVLVVSAKSRLAPAVDCNILPGFILPKDIRGGRHGKSVLECIHP